jgi:hypothetical protein
MIPEDRSDQTDQIGGFLFIIPPLNGNDARRGDRYIDDMAL